MSQLPQRTTGQWSLNNASGEAVVRFTSFLSLDLRNESLVVSGPVEEGGFATYNKVETPLEVDVSLGIEGDDATLQTVLDTLDKLQAGTELLSLVTPNAEYQDLNLEGFNYRRRREDGLGVLWVDLSLVGVKQVKAEYANARVGRRKQRGKVQPVERSGLKGIGNTVRGWFGGGK